MDTVKVLLIIGAGFAGWVDAIVGGGGLILIPLIMLLMPGLSPAQVMASNKVAAVTGTASAAVSLLRKIPQARHSLRFAPLAFVGAGCGAALVANIDKAIMRPIVIVLLLAVGLFVAFRPAFGTTANPQRGTRALIFSLLLIASIGVYDGIFGPGTGVFFIMGLSAIRGLDFLTASAWAKVLNTSTNIGALITFAVGGHIIWSLGLMLAVANIIGAQIGVRMALSRGSGFIRMVLLVVVVIMVARLSYDQFFATV